MIKYFIYQLLFFKKNPSTTTYKSTSHQLPKNKYITSQETYFNLLNNNIIKSASEKINLKQILEKSNKKHGLDMNGE
ncbi:hypothetical protein Scep_022491 [Stephania cephalantha]|uniref:Uncharacterized protein n=1 Tax=Stephania cephalantha TaxID=152367 RepID=A0AAP0FB81_9MAGN